MTQRSEYYVRKFALGLLAIAAVGCASNVPQPRDGRAAGEWRFRLPATNSPYGSLAFGRGGSSEPAQLQQEQPLLAAAQPAAKHVARPVRAQRSVAPLQTAAAQPIAAPAESAPAVQSPVQVTEPVQLAANDTTPEQRYGQREAQSKKLEQYRGGDAIVIGAGTLVVILLIVILLILLLR